MTALSGCPCARTTAPPQLRSGLLSRVGAVAGLQPVSAHSSSWYSSAGVLQRGSAASLSRRGQQSRTMQAPRAALSPDNASVFVAGGGGIALDVTRRLKDMGAWVWMMQRNESRRSEIEGMMAIVVKGDALDEASVKAAFDQIEEVDAVVSTVGGTPADARADSEGNINLIKAALAKGVKRFVLVTSIGTGDSRDAPPKQVYEVLEKVLIEKAKAEDFLMVRLPPKLTLLEQGANAGKMEYTIIRPGGLKSEPATGNGVLTESTAVCGAIHRDDAADLVTWALFQDSTANKVLSAVDEKQLMGEPKFEVFARAR